MSERLKIIFAKQDAEKLIYRTGHITLNVIRGCAGLGASIFSIGILLLFYDLANNRFEADRLWSILGLAVSWVVASKVSDILEMADTEILPE